MGKEVTQFKPGEGGRPPGAKNRTTAEFKRMMADFLAGNFERVQEELNKQAGHRYIDSFVKLAKFVPDFLSNDVKVDASGEIKISVEYLPSVHLVKNLEQEPILIEQPFISKLNTPGPDRILHPAEEQEPDLEELPF